MGKFICNDCGAEIPPEWKGALAKNECPGCLGSIMSDTEQALIIELGEAMKEMPNDPIGVAGWIVSNFRLQKIGDCEPVEKFHDKSNRAPVQQDDGKLPHERVDKVSNFFKNAGFDVDRIKDAEQAKAKVLSGGGDITGTNLEDDEYMLEDDYEVNEGTINAIDEVNSLLGDAEENSETAKARAFLEQKRIRQLEAQRNVASGVGAVSRSGSPAGFRRV